MGVCVCTTARVCVTAADRTIITENKNTGESGAKKAAEKCVAIGVMMGVGCPAPAL